MYASKTIADCYFPLFRREKAIKDLLARSASKLDEWMTRGIVGSLKIPIPWVNEAKVSPFEDGDPFIS